MDIKYGIMVVTRESVMNDGNTEVFHFCGYEKPPTVESYVSLYRELCTDTEFGLTEKMDSMILVPAPPEVVEDMKPDFKTLSDIYDE